MKKHSIVIGSFIVEVAVLTIVLVMVREKLFTSFGGGMLSHLLLIGISLCLFYGVAILWTELLFKVTEPKRSIVDTSKSINLLQWCARLIAACFIILVLTLSVMVLIATFEAFASEPLLHRILSMIMVICLCIIVSIIWCVSVLDILQHWSDKHNGRTEKKE